MTRLLLLGSAALQRDDSEVHAFLAGPKRVGLLAYLVLARPRGFQRRDAILHLLWPQRGQKAARNALSNMLYHVRQALGEGVIVNRGIEEIGVSRERFWTDTIAFEEALRRGAPEQALDLYRGDLLEGFHIPGASSEFDRWLSEERERLRMRAADGAWQLADAAVASGAHSDARAWAKRAAGLTPFSEEAHSRLIVLLDRVGDRTGALRAYDAFAARLKREWEVAPSDDLRRLVDGIRSSARALATPTASPVAPPPDRSIAVLPFEALGEPSRTAFSEGIHGGVLTRLSNVADLRVISRTSVRQYAHTSKTIPEIGHALGAAWVLEGDVQEMAGQVMVNVRLVNTRSDQQVWAHAYRRQLTAENLFQIQIDITKAIVRSLEARFVPAEEERVNQRPTANLEAYRLCVQGRTHLDKRTERGMRKALDYFQRALEQDDRFALAWVGLADAFALLHDYGYEDADGVLPRAEDSARRALALDPKCAEAHASLGEIFTIRHEGPDAIRELRQAIALRPGYAEAHNWLSWLSNLLGYREEALDSARRAVELNPLSPEAVSNLALSFLANGNLNQALVEAQRDHELGSSWGTAQFYEGIALYELRRFDEAVAVLQDLSAPWAGQGPRATLALAHLASGARDETLALLPTLETDDAFAAGLVQAALGNREDAFNAWERVEHWGHWPTLALRHFYRNVWITLQGDARYGMLLEEIDRSWELAPPA